MRNSQAQCLSHVTKQLDDAPSKAPPKVIFSGIQPTGVPHLGNYLGALRPWASLQDSAAPKDELLFSVVDLHALSGIKPPEAAELRQWRRETLAALLAVGLKPERSSIFCQWDVSSVRW